MSAAQIQADVANLLGIILGRQVAHGESIARDSEPAWDSLKHVEFILMLEEHFGVHFNEEEMASFRSSDEIVRAIERKNAA